MALPSLLTAGAELSATCVMPETTGIQVAVPLAAIRAMPFVSPNESAEVARKPKKMSPLASVVIGVLM